MRTESYAQGALQGATELYRDAAQQPRYRRAGADGVWVEDRAATEAEASALDAWEQDAREQQLRDAAGSALAGNRAWLALSAPTQAQTLAQVRALTRQVSALIRLELRQLDSTE